MKTDRYFSWRIILEAKILAKKENWSSHPHLCVRGPESLTNPLSQPELIDNYFHFINTWIFSSTWRFFSRKNVIKLLKNLVYPPHNMAEHCHTRRLSTMATEKRQNNCQKVDSETNPKFTTSRFFEKKKLDLFMLTDRIYGYN